jgi:ketosteroid isomerase-like protein
VNYLTLYAAMKFGQKGIEMSILRFLLAVVAFACLPSTCGAQSANRGSVDQMNEGKLVVQKWEHAFNARDQQALSALLMDDAVAIDPFGIMRGKQTLSALNPNVIKLGITLSFNVESVEPVAGASSLVVIGSYKTTFADPNTRPSQGNYLMLLEKQNEDWKIRSMVTSRLAAPAPP